MSYFLHPFPETDLEHGWFSVGNELADTPSSSAHSTGITRPPSTGAKGLQMCSRRDPLPPGSLQVFTKARQAPTSLPLFLLGMPCCPPGQCTRPSRYLPAGAPGSLPSRLTSPAHRRAASLVTAAKRMLDHSNAHATGLRDAPRNTLALGRGDWGKGCARGPCTMELHSALVEKECD